MNGTSPTIRPDRYQVFLVSCPASVPVQFASHPWFVVNKKGTLSRWEVLMLRRKSCKMRWGHLHKDRFLPFQGIAMLFFWARYKWKHIEVLGVVEGGEGSLAHRMAEFIENSPKEYPLCEKYSLLCPNSNTYAQWVIDHFPECGLHLPWNSFGKTCKSIHPDTGGR